MSLPINKIITGDDELCTNVNIATNSSNQHEQTEDFVLKLVAIEDSQEDNPSKDLIAPFMKEIRIALKKSSEPNMQQIQNTGEKCLQELKHMNMEILKSNLVRNAEIQELINTMMIIQNLLSIDGFVESIISNSMLRNMVLGGKVLRFKYCAKASKIERNTGVDHVAQNTHPTVKPLKLMQYLCKLVTPPGVGIILDPFCGSGSTLLAAQKLGINYVGIEKTQEYVAIVEQRLAGVNQDLFIEVQD